MANPDYPVLRLKKSKEKSITRRHPWVFSGAFSHIPELLEGDKIYVADHNEKILATAYFGSGSITARILAFEKREINESFYGEKIAQAFALRKALNLVDSAQTNTFRLIHGEGDGIPGLVIDLYNKVAVIQSHSKGIENDIDLITAALQKELGNQIESIHSRSTDNTTDSAEGEGKTKALEYGNKFLIDYVRGQKTGFFIDQRENRKILAAYAEGKKVLNAFSYSGGFSIYALKAGAKEVHSLDSSKSAMLLVEENLALNKLNSENHRSIVDDALAYINSEEAKREGYDIVVLDPPAFAKHKSARHRAIQAYKRLNARTMRILKKEALLFTFSCSQVVTPDLFYSTIRSAAIEANRTIQILQFLHQPPDHPVSIFHPEGEYLKGLILRVH